MPRLAKTSIVFDLIEVHKTIRVIAGILVISIHNIC